MAAVDPGGEGGGHEERQHQQNDREDDLPDGDAERQAQQHGCGSGEGNDTETLGQEAVGRLDNQRYQHQHQEQWRQEEKHPLESVGIAVEPCRKGCEEGSVEEISQEEEEQEKPCHQRQVDGREALHGLVDKLDGGIILRSGLVALGGQSTNRLLFAGLSEEVGMGSLNTPDGSGGEHHPQHQLHV